MNEDTLKSLALEVRNAQDDSLKSALNKRYHDLLNATLALPGSFDYPFDSLKTIAKIYSPDRQFRIYNWNLPKSDGTNSYFFMIQVKDKKKIRLLEMTDVSDTLKNPELRILSGRKWYGALYYKILAERSGSKTYYTLFGWDGCSTSMYQKLIDVLTFDSRGNPVFGSRIFRKYADGRNVRVIFQYSSQSTMLLKYTEQTIETGKKTWNKSRKAYEPERRSVKMIIFDQLGALQEPQEGQPVYNVPVGENYDGFLFGNGAWNYVRNIAARN